MNNKGFNRRAVVPSLVFAVLVVLVNNSNEHEPVAQVMSLLLAGIAFAGSFVCIYTTLNARRIRKVMLILLVVFGMFAGVYVLATIGSPSKALGAYRSALILSVYGIVFMFYIWGRRGYAPSVLSFASIIVVIAFGMYVLASLLGQDYRNYTGHLINPNTFGMWAAVMTIIVTASRPQGRIVTIASVVVGMYLVYISSSRTALIALLIGLLLLMSPKRILRLRLVRIGILPVLFCTAGIVIYVYAYVDISMFNELSRELAGKNLLSGRDYIWPLVIEQVRDNMWLGLGSGSGLSSVGVHGLGSAHNAFLQTALQTGIIGVVAMVATITSVYCVIVSTVDSVYYRVMLALCVMVIIMQNFEVSLFQNNLALTYPVWAMIGLGYGHHLHSIDAYKNERHIPSSTPA